MIRLIDETASKTITFDGVDFVIRQLNGAQKLTLSQSFVVRNGELIAPVEPLIPTIAKGIISINAIAGAEKMTPLQTLRRVDSEALFMFLIVKLVEYSTLTEEEIKNSDSSSDSPSSTGSVEAESVDNASGDKTE